MLEEEKRRLEGSRERRRLGEEKRRLLEDEERWKLDEVERRILEEEKRSLEGSRERSTLEEGKRRLLDEERRSLDEERRLLEEEERWNLGEEERRSPEREKMMLEKEERRRQNGLRERWKLVEEEGRSVEAKERRFLEGIREWRRLEEEKRLLLEAKKRMVEAERRMLEEERRSREGRRERWMLQEEERRRQLGWRERRMLEDEERRRQLEGGQERRRFEDVEKEILVRLPAEELGRCKLVCKGWCDLISSPDFVSEHLKRSQLDPSRCLILFHDSDPGLHGDSARPPGPFKSVVCFSSYSSYVVGSVNGLICIAGDFRDGVTSPDNIWILNPVTRLSFELPLPASPTIRGREGVYFSFCWDSSSDDSEESYKVFKIVCERQHPRKPYFQESMAQPIVSNRVEVWDSRYPNKWTEIIVDFPRPFFHPPGWFTSCDIIVESSAYWIVADANGVDLLLLSIDMKTHAVKLIPLPKLSLPGDFLLEKLINFRNGFLFGSIWEERFALVERHDRRRMLYNVWAMNVCGTSWIKKTTFSVDFGFNRFLGCVDGKLMLERNDFLNVLFDMRTEKSEVLRKNFLSIQKQNTLLENNDTRNEKVEVVGFFEFPDVYVVSAHDFVGTLVSIEGFKPIRSFANFPHDFTLFWPNLAAFASKVSSSTSSDAWGEKVPPVFEPASVVVLPTSSDVPSGVEPDSSVNVSPAAAKGSVPSAEKVKVNPVGAPAANEAPKPTYASLVAKWTRVNSPGAAQVTPKAPPIPLGANGAPKSLAVN